jgi:MSHA biogenesis protein MshN
MSLINKVLQDLDQRSAMSTPDGKPPQQVRAVPPPRGGREWFWRIVAGLIMVALGWVGWIAYQLQPRAVATELAYQVAEEAKRKTAAPITKPDADKAAQQPNPATEPAKPVAAARTPAAQQEPLKLALSIDTPVTTRPEALPRPALPAPKPLTAKAQKPAPSTAAPNPEPLPLALLAPSNAPSKVEKRDQARSATDKAETEFRRGAALLNQGRVSEAERALSAALSIDPSHESARQTLIALYLEQRRIPEATRLLQDGLVINPAQGRFGIVLARVHAERGDYPSALELLNRVRAVAQGDAEFNSLLGAVLQKLGRHAEAAEAYRVAVQALPQNGISWVGLAISLEALARRPEAADAFRRAVSTGTLTADVRTYAEQRVRALH